MWSGVEGNEHNGTTTEAPLSDKAKGRSFWVLGLTVRGSDFGVLRSGHEVEVIEWCLYLEEALGALVKPILKAAMYMQSRS